MYRWSGKAFFIALVLLGPPAFAEKTLDVFLDMDGFFLYEVHGRMKKSRPERILVANGSEWRLSDGAEELLQVRELRGWKIRHSFFSARDKERNTEAARKILLPGGRTAWDAVEGRVFSFHHLREVEIDGKQKARKDLEHVGKGLPGFKLGNAILIDDSFSHAHPDQRANILQVPTTSYFHESLMEVFDPKQGEITPGEHQNAVRDYLAYRNQMAYAIGLLDVVLEAAGESLAPVKVLEKIQWTTEALAAGWNPLQLHHRTTQYPKRGGAILRKVNAKFLLHTVEDGWPLKCSDREMLMEWATLNNQ